MAADRPRPPESLRDAVAASLGPVKPLRSPGRRALALVPVGLTLLIVMPAFWGMRANLSKLPWLVSWGLSAVQAFAGLWIVALGLRESVPGRQLSGSAVAGVVTAAGCLFVAVTLVSGWLLPTVVPAGRFVPYAWECFNMAMVWSVPALGVAAWLAWRALPTRPWLAGVLCGLGAGVMADAGVRLFCWVSSPAHVLLAHGGAILALALLGGFAAAAGERLASSR